MENKFDTAVFCDNILFLRRFAGMGRIRFARLLSVDLPTLKAIDSKTENLRIDLKMLLRLRTLLGDEARYLFFYRLEDMIYNR
ncbi:MAG: hypothetical protein IJC50_09435 [Clostridia bacterium]|nr:hypothetical protein [Clostridia bacterium]